MKQAPPATEYNMAPPPSHRGSRGGPRHPRAGGITKRRNAPRVDKDGDIKMAADPIRPPTGPSEGRGRGRGSGRGGGTDRGRGRGSDRGRGGGRGRGAARGGSKPPSTTANDTKRMLLAVLADRYDAEKKLLDLSALGADQTLSNLGTFGSQALAEKSFKALVYLAGSEYTDPREKKEAIQAVSLARNEIRDVAQVFSLAKSLPDLRRLDLSGNALESFANLSQWRFEFRYLEELHLTGNPLTNQPDYAAEVVSWYPCLQILDGHQVRTPEESAQANKTIRLILELSKKTGMNAQYSEMCLSGVANWDMDMALKSFEEQKANLPPEAFITPAA